jgi:hypothetical protein
MFISLQPIRLTTFKIILSLMLNNLYLKPQERAEKSWIQQCKKAPKITPRDKPNTLNLGTKKKIPKIIPRLYKIGAKE